jgi:hypothetical protein
LGQAVDQGRDSQWINGSSCSSRTTLTTSP